MKKSVVLFSGGIDSTYTVMKKAGDFDILILLTYRTPGMFNLHRAKRTAEKIKSVHGNKIEHRVIDIRKDVSSVRGGTIKCIKNNCKYRFFYSWCLGCKLTMHLKTIDICLSENIRIVMDGSNVEDAHSLEQSPECENFFKNLYSAKGISFLSPFYHKKQTEQHSRGRLKKLLRKIGLYKPPTERKAEYLNKSGIPTGRHFFSQYRSIQPSCSISLLFNLPRVFLRAIFEEKKENYIKYLKDTCKNIQHDM